MNAHNQSDVGHGKSSFEVFGLLTVAAVTMVPLWGCGGGSSNSTLPGATCSMNSECAQGLTCSFGRCQSACKAERDCPTGQQCVKNASGINSCLLPAIEACHYNSECQSPLVCGADLKCRNQCQSDRDCATATQKCVFPGGVCAEPNSIAADGTLRTTQSGIDGGALDAATDDSPAAPVDMREPVTDAPYSDRVSDMGRSDGGTDLFPDVRAPDVPVAQDVRGTSTCTDAGACSPGATMACGLSATQTCSASCTWSQCSCINGYSLCNSICVNLQTDDSNCSACNNKCGSNLKCLSGRCTPNPASDAATTPATAISAGVDFACATLSNGSIECWGYNDAFGELGNGTTTNSCTPVAVTGVSNAAAVSAGFFFACALLSSGSVECWGDNYNGELGKGTNTGSSTPVSVTGLSNAIAISASRDSSNHFACALLSGGSVECWGDNGVGELGNGATARSSTPVSVTGLSNAMAISAGNSFACALLSGGSVECWGYNYYGTLGNGTVANSLTPVSVAGLSNATALSAGSDFACALLSNGSVECWGYNKSGQLGNGSSSSMLATPPVAVTGLSNATALSAGSDFACALLSSGSVECWGYNGSGQLGNGTTSTSPNPTPVSVTGLSNAIAISAGSDFACALLSNGSVECWGDNVFGQLGDGTVVTSSIPVPVMVTW